MKSILSCISLTQAQVWHHSNKSVSVSAGDLAYFLRIVFVCILCCSMANLESNIRVLREGISEKEQTVSDEIIDK